jgi:probable HAF family extracellular repeat protein
MKKNLKALMIGLSMCTALAIPIRMRGQEGKGWHHHYKLIDLGTFGGPNSYVTFPDFNSEADVNNQGVLAGWADTSAPDPFPDFCFWDCFVVHAFQWRNGVTSDLGVLPRGASSQPAGISANGLITGWSQNGEIDPLVMGYPENRAVLWNEGKIRDLGTLPEGGYESLGFAINSSGLVVGLATNTTPDPNSMLGLGYQARAFLWDKQRGMQDLGTLPGGTDAQALLVNERGQVVGWSYTSSAPTAVCALEGLSLTTGSFLWDEESGMVNLGGFGGSCTLAQGLNNRGQVVGESFPTGDQFTRAFLWDRATGLKDLGTLGGDYAEAIAINDYGEAVGGSSLRGDVQVDAALWANGGIIDLGSVAGDCGSFAFWINASGQVVGSSSICSTGSSRGFLWEDGGPMADLNTLIVPSSSLFVPWGITINDRGEIAAKGVLPSGDEHAVLLIPCDENHPGIEGCDYSLVDTNAVAPIRPALTSQGAVAGASQVKLFPAELMARFRPLRTGRNRCFGSPQTSPQ